MIINRVTLLGHKDHGKSTMIGNLLILTGAASKQRIKEAEKTSTKLGRQFEPGYILDSFEEERENEMTIDTTRAQIKYKDTAFEFIDVPGHEELIKNMISGASYATFALLMVSAKPGEGVQAQTKRHIFLAKMLGMTKIIVAVNKMDTVNYKEDAFKSIIEEIGSFLEKIGLNRDGISFIPVSAYSKDNLIKKSEKLDWYKGHPLLELMREVANSGNVEKEVEHLRIILQGMIPHRSGTMLIGKIISGKLKKGMGITIMPLNLTSHVKQIIVKGSRKSAANVGENVALLLDHGINRDTRGCVAYDSHAVHDSTGTIDSTIFLTKKIGNRASIKFNGSQINARLSVKEIIDTTTGNPILKGGDHALNAVNATIRLGRKIPSEPFSESKELGRFVVYDGNDFAGIGIIS